MAAQPPPAGSAQQAHPLRPYYQPPEDSVFIATAPRFSTTGIPGAASRSSGDASAGSSSKAFGAATAPMKPDSNRYISSNDAKPYVATTSTGGFGETDISISDIFRALLISGALQCTSTCLAMPFEVGKLLLQVQWVPRDDVWLQLTQQAALAQRRTITKPQQTRPPREIQDSEEPEAWEQEVAPEANEWDDEATAQDAEAEEEMIDAEISDEEDVDAYFRDVTSRPTRPDTSLYSGRKKRRMVDASGYVMRKSVYDQGARPEFVMPVIVIGGVWEMMKAVGRGKEGWLGLWKGSLTSFVLEVTSSTIQPFVSSIISLFAPTALSPLPLAYAPYPYKTLGLLLSSHLITGILVSPLDLIRTRLIAQSTLPAHRKYSGPYDAMQKTLREEGGWKTAYLHPNLLIPTILDFTLRPLLSLGAPLLIEHTLRLEPTTHPISYAIAELAISTASLCITLPIETVRRRLQLQIRKPYGSNEAEASTSSARKITSATLQQQQQQQTGLAPSHGGITLITGNVGVRGLRTCVETRPIAYVGVVEAIYRIVTEETVATHMGFAKPDQASSLASDSGGTASNDTSGSAAGQNPMAQSGILAAKTGYSSLGGLRSLYRGFGMAFSANLVVFMLTLVSGERAGPAGWAEI
ncbi:related to UGO1 - outer membrane component of the mitochondrial fusion machinery [Ustilago sp. UG-2017b]|nr:related to UGO1 - outer membrane component of the mitochondrial fusion machinery [Ustilago sp. UG-2017b]